MNFIYRGISSKTLGVFFVLLYFCHHRRHCERSLHVNETRNLMETYVDCLLCSEAKTGWFWRMNFYKNSMTLTHVVRNLFIHLNSKRFGYSLHTVSCSIHFSSNPFLGFFVFAWIRILHETTISKRVFAVHLNENYIHTTEWMRCWFCIAIFDLAFGFKTYTKHYTEQEWCSRIGNAHLKNVFDVLFLWPLQTLMRIALSGKRNWTWMKWTQER